MQLNVKIILQGKGKVTAELARVFAESEFEKYRAIPDKTYKSDFNNLIIEIDPYN